MVLAADIRTVLPVILLSLSLGCSRHPGNTPESSTISYEEAKSPVNPVDSLEYFIKAKPYWDEQKYESDSLMFYYEKLLEENLSPDGRIKVINRLAYILDYSKDFTASYKKYLNALPLIPLLSPPYWLQGGITLYNIGNYHYHNNQSDSAIFYLLKARETFDKIKTGRQDFKTYSLYKLANEYHWKLEDYAKAEIYYKLALENLDTINIPRGIKDSLQFNIKYSTASMYRTKGEFDKAVLYAEDALNFADSCQNQGWVEINLSLLSCIYRDMNDFELARKYSWQAIELNKKTGHPPGNRTIYFRELSQIYSKLHRNDEALLYCQIAREESSRACRDILRTSGWSDSLKNREEFIEIASKIPDPAYLSLVLENLAACHEMAGSIYQETGKPEMAMNEFRETLKLRKIRFGDHHKKTAETHYLIGKLFQQINRLDSALSHFQSALISGSAGFNSQDFSRNPSLIQIETNIELIDVLRDKASVLKLIHVVGLSENGFFETSLDCLKLCDSLIDYTWNSYANENSRLFLESKVHPVYEQIIETAYQLSKNGTLKTYLDDIYSYMERSRYRFLRNNLITVQAFSKARIPGNLVTRLREQDYYVTYFTREKAKSMQLLDSIQEMVDVFRVELPSDRQRHASVGEKLDSIKLKIKYAQDQLFEHINNKDRLLDSLTKTYPELKAAKTLQSSNQLVALKKTIRRSNNLLVQYFSGEDNIYIFSTDGLKSNVQKISNDSVLHSTVGCVIASYTNNQQNIAEFRNFALNSYNLYDQLLRGTLQKYRKDRLEKLIIVPDGKLNLIAFDALIQKPPADTAFIDYKDLDYLVKHYSISYGFSSSMLTMAPKAFNKTTRSKVLAFSYGISKESDQTLANLAGTNRELEAIRGHAGGRFLMNDSATETNFKQYAEDYAIIHLALHGQASSTSNDSTMLLFRKSNAGQDDGRLMPEELYRIKFNSKLIVLSSCESGMGKYFRGEGIYSMARAFAFAGCPALVVTLWQIPDQSSAELISRFYSRISQKNAPDLALRKSKTDYLASADEYSSHPKYWASFIPLGEMHRIKLKRPGDY